MSYKDTPLIIEEIGPGKRRMMLQQLWDAGRRWADANGHEHNSSVVQGIAPL